MVRFDWWSLALCLLALALLAAALPFLSAEAECHAVCTPVAAGGNCNCAPGELPVSEAHWPSSWLYLPFVARVGAVGM